MQLLVVLDFLVCWKYYCWWNVGYRVRVRVNANVIRSKNVTSPCFVRTKFPKTGMPTLSAQLYSLQDKIAFSDQFRTNVDTWQLVCKQLLTCLPTKPARMTHIFKFVHHNGTSYIILHSTYAGNVHCNVCRTKWRVCLTTFVSMVFECPVHAQWKRRKSVSS